MKKLTINTLFVLAGVALLTQTASALPVQVPDAGTTSTLLGIGLAGLAVLRKYVR